MKRIVKRRQKSHEAKKMATCNIRRKYEAKDKSSKTEGCVQKECNQSISAPELRDVCNRNEFEKEIHTRRTKARKKDDQERKIGRKKERKPEIKCTIHTERKRKE